MNDLTVATGTTSMQIANVVGKLHHHVMRDIRDEIEKLESGGISSQSMFGLSERTDSTGRKIPYYELTKEGVLQLAARYDAVTRAKLIEMAMRQDKPQLPQSFAEALRLAADLEEQRQKLLPKAQGYDYLMNASGTVTIGEAAKIIDIKGIGPNKFFKLLVAEEIIFKRGNSYLPYSEYKEHFIVKQNPISIGDTLKERSQLYLSMADLDWLAKFLTKRGYQVNYTAQKCLA
jgi:anti-repressor protein